MQLTMPDAVTLERVRRVALLELNKRGLATVDELAQLADAHVDDVLDVLFLHCGMIRVRTSDDRYLEIRPGRTMQ